MLSRLTSDCRQSDTREFAAGWSKTGANLLAAQPVRPNNDVLYFEAGGNVLTAQSALDFELKHKVIIERFGRYPHRNAILGRKSTSEELAFLNEPNSSF